MSGTITPTQVLSFLNLQGTNYAAANRILPDSTLTDINLAALGVLPKNEVGGNIAQAYELTAPAPTLRGNSDWNDRSHPA